MNQDFNHRQFLTKLRELLCAHFTKNELEILAFDLGLDPENFSRGKQRFAMDLIIAVDHRRRLEEFIEQVKMRRPHVNWQISDAAPDSNNDLPSSSEIVDNDVVGKDRQESHVVNDVEEITNYLIQEQPQYTSVQPTSSTSPNVVPYRSETRYWWRARQYEDNPFQYFNADRIPEDKVSLLESWWIEPNVESYNEAGHSRKVLEKLKINLENLVGYFRSRSRLAVFLKITSRLLDIVNGTLGVQVSYATSDILGRIMLEITNPVIVYAIGGGGKTFYRRLTRRQLMMGRGHRQVEIKNPADYVEQLDALTSIDLAKCIYKCICEEFNVESSYANGTLFQWLKACDDLIATHTTRGNTLCYVLLDGLDQFFADSQDPNSAEYRKFAMQNHQALIAISELLRAVTKRANNHLALRIFAPLILRQHLRKQLGPSSLRSVIEISLKWNEVLVMQVIESRLKSLYPETKPIRDSHLPLLLAHEAIPGLQEWFRARNGLTPGCAIRVMENLVDRSLDHGHDPISKEHCDGFLNSKDTKEFCTQDTPYPFPENPTNYSIFRTQWHGFPSIARHVPRFNWVFLLAKSLGWVINRIAYFKDFIGALLLLTVFVTIIIYISSCMISAGHSLQVCARHPWDIITTLLFGDP